MGGAALFTISENKYLQKYCFSRITSPPQHGNFLLCFTIKPNCSYHWMLFFPKISKKLCVSRNSMWTCDRILAVIHVALNYIRSKKNRGCTTNRMWFHIALHKIWKWEIAWRGGCTTNQRCTYHRKNTVIDIASTYVASTALSASTISVWPPPWTVRVIWKNNYMRRWIISYLTGSPL